MAELTLEARIPDDAAASISSDLSSLNLLNFPQVPSHIPNRSSGSTQLNQEQGQPSQPESLNDNSNNNNNNITVLAPTPSPAVSPQISILEKPVNNNNNSNNNNNTVTVPQSVNLSPSPPPSSMVNPKNPTPPLPSPFPFLSQSQSNQVRSISPSSPSPSLESPAPVPAVVPSLSFESLMPPLLELPTIKLAQNREQQLLYDNLSDLYSLLVTLEHLEMAYVRDAVNSSVYQSSCSKLLTQLKTLRDAVNHQVPDLNQFCRDFGLECRQALNRITAGVPATVLHGEGQNQKGRDLAVFHVVQHFITAMDSLKLNLKAVDQLHPSLSDLLDSINKVVDLPPDHEAKVKVKEWLSRLSLMRASDELDDESVRQLSFDLDTAYASFHRFVQGMQ